MTFDLNEFFAGIRLRAHSFPMLDCPIARKNLMPQTFPEVHDHGITLWQFEDSGQRNLRLGELSQRKS